MKNLAFLLLISWLCGCNGPTSIPAVENIQLSANNVRPASVPASEMRHYRKSVGDFVDSVFDRRPFNGSILVAKNGEIVLEKYYGFRNPKISRDSISASTPFHLASVSKTFTAMAVLKLQEQGKLSIGDSVAQYLSGFPLKGVTIKTLLNHRSGIPNYVHYMENLGWDRKRFITNQDVLDFLIARHNDIQIAPADRRFSYSNTNYALLALIVEKVTGQPFADFMRLSFFDPLDMKDTYVFTMADSAKALPSYFYNGRQYAFEYLDKVYGDKNVYSTVRDMLKWDQALYEGGLFKKETLDEAFTGYSFEKPGINNYGLGWRMFQLKSEKKFVYHNGWWHGNRTAFYRLPDDKVTIIALSNNDFTKVYSSKKIADIFGNYFNNQEDKELTETVRAVKNISPQSRETSKLTLGPRRS